MAGRLPSRKVNEYRVLRLLHGNSSIDQRSIARDLNISLGSVNYSLRALIERGHVKAQNFRNSKNKVGYIYLLTPSGIAEKSQMAARFLADRLREYELIEREIAAARKDVEESGNSVPEDDLCKEDNAP